ncbi:arylamine N-acetyltransferase family protein [Paenibacillus zanthoxyli]|uniref:hypothetical protein n=1 Tax=Paenibacillus zanthoxyli TaxID=369399 RepID=UPI0004B9DCF0|nr:hypothetical protein [Paenibacillus zanthoxyli]
MLNNETQQLELSRELAEAVLERLGFNQWPDINLTSLNALYRAWCAHVPQDSIHKRFYFGNGRTGPLPIGNPVEIFHSFLKHSTGGTCWTHAIGLYSLLQTIGFPVRAAAGSMVGLTPPENGPSHGTVIARHWEEWIISWTAL